MSTDILVLIGALALLALAWAWREMRWLRRQERRRDG